MTTLSPALDRHAAELGVSRRRPAEVHDGPRPADELLDGCRDQCGLGEEPVELVGVLDQRQHPLRDPCASRLVAGEHHQLEEVAVLRVGEAVALDLRVDEARDEIVGRVPAALLADLASVLEQRPRGRAVEREGAAAASCCRRRSDREGWSEVPVCEMVESSIIIGASSSGTPRIETRTLIGSGAAIPSNPVELALRSEASSNSTMISRV